MLHGGLFSKDETTLNDVRKIQRHQASQSRLGTSQSWPKIQHRKGPLLRSLPPTSSKDMGGKW